MSFFILFYLFTYKLEKKKETSFLQLSTNKMINKRSIQVLCGSASIGYIVNLQSEKKKIQRFYLRSVKKEHSHRLRWTIEIPLFHTIRSPFSLVMCVTLLSHDSQNIQNILFQMLRTRSKVYGRILNDIGI